MISQVLANVYISAIQSHTLSTRLIDYDSSTWETLCESKSNVQAVNKQTTNIIHRRWLLIMTTTGQHVEVPQTLRMRR